MLKAEGIPANHVRGFLLRKHVLSNCHEFHLRSNDTATCISDLRYRISRTSTQRLLFSPREIFQLACFFAMQKLFTVRISIIFRPRYTPLILFHVPVPYNPLMPRGLQPLANIM